MADRNPVTIAPTQPLSSGPTPAAEHTEAPPAFTVVVPAYNEQDAIRETLAALDAALAEAGPHEIIVVNDGSVDETAQRLAEVEADYPRLQVLEHPVNQGYGAALKTGIRRARGPLIAIADADGTYPLHDLPRLIARQAELNADMVVGARTGDDVTYPMHRKAAKVWLVMFASWVARRPIPDMNSGMRVFRREAAMGFINIFPDGFSFTTTITLAMLTNHYYVHYEPINYKARVGQSKIRPIRDTLGFFQIIGRVGMYFAPLRILMPVALLLLLLATVSLGVDIYRVDLTEKTLLLFLFALNAVMFALLADMIDKRAGP